MTTTTSGRSRGEESEIRIKGTKRNKEIFHVIFGESHNLANGGAAQMDLALVDKCVFYKMMNNVSGVYRKSLKGGPQVV